MTGKPTLDAAAWQALHEDIEGDVHRGMTYRGAYATDASIFQKIPEAVIWPANQQDCRIVLDFCRRFNLCVLGRGAGTSLSGQTVTRGVVLDFSRYMNKILDVDPDNRRVRVEPGTVLSQLNAHIQPHGLHFPPDPATANRATIGGMIANNSCGTRSIRYGRTGDYVTELKVLLSDGHLMQLKRLDDSEWRAACAEQSRSGELHHCLDTIISEHNHAIREHFPKLPRRVAGYALDALASGEKGLPGCNGGSLIDILVGSEGTLGLVMEATLSLVPLPTATQLLVVHFDNLFDAVGHVTDIIRHSPSAVELLDHIVINEASINASTKHLASSLRTPKGDAPPQAVLMIEFCEDSKAAAIARAEACLNDLRTMPGFMRCVELSEPQDQKDAWDVRRLGLGLISNQPGERKGVAFIEDACVPLEHLGHYTRFIYNLCADEQVPISTYAHASVGVLHFRPMLDMHTQQDRERLQRIADAAFDEVLRLQGVFSGEHGDGLIRGPYIRRQFGDTLYEAMAQVKHAFDPTRTLNPGCKIDTAHTDADLRYGAHGYEEALSQTGSHFDYGEQGNLADAAEQCNGVGACRKLTEGTMCPSYRATRDETHSTRGRANLLRLAISGQLQDGHMESDTLHEALELCLACKACKAECPNAVDMAKMKAEAMQAMYDIKGVPATARFIADAASRMMWMKGWRAELANHLARKPWVKRQLKKRYGFDPRRPLPAISPTSLEAMLKRNGLPAKRSKNDRRPRVALLADTFVRRLEPWIGLAAVELLEGCGISVHIMKSWDSQRPRISAGLLREAKSEGERLWREMKQLTDAKTPILCIDPGEASSLKDDLPALQDHPSVAARVADNVHLLEDWLWPAVQRLGVKLQPAPKLATRQVMLHRHCHQKALFSKDAAANLLRHAGLDVTDPDTGCCGMAGSFGYLHYDVSMQVAEDSVLPEARHAINRGRQLLATGTSCRQQLRDSLSVEPAHWVEVIRAVPEA